MYHIAYFLRDGGINYGGFLKDKDKLPLQLGAFLLSKGKRMLNKFVLAIDNLNMIKYNNQTMIQFRWKKK